VFVRARVVCVRGARHTAAQVLAGHADTHTHTHIGQLRCWQDMPIC